MMGDVESDICLSTPEFVRPPKFDFDDPEEAKQGCAYLEEHGYVIAKSVLDTSEVTKAHGMFWDFLEGIPDRMDTKYPGFKEDMGTNVDRNDIMTWTNYNWPGAHQTGIINDYGANHSPFAWFVRSRPRVKKVFEHVWGTNDLLVSFDAVNAFRPWEFEKEWKTKGGWFHVDQNPRIVKNKVCVQGLVALTPVTEQSGGLCVIPDTHKDFVQLGERVKINWTHHFVAIPRDDCVLKKQSFVLLCDPGDLCLWDSRTVHCNAPGVERKEEVASLPLTPLLDEVLPGPTVDTKGMTWQAKQHVKRDQEAAQKRAMYLVKKAQREKWELLRLVAYVCMTPSSLADAEVLRLRQEAVKQCQGTSHWPQYFIPSSKEQPGFGTNPYIVKELIVGNNKGGNCNLM